MRGNISTFYGLKSQSPQAGWNGEWVALLPCDVLIPICERWILNGMPVDGVNNVKVIPLISVTVHNTFSHSTTMSQQFQKVMYCLAEGLSNSSPIFDKDW